MSERPIKKLRLKSGLAVHLIDASRKIAGDRWFVSLIARMEIPVTKEIGNSLNKQIDGPKIDFDKIIECLGDTVVFEKKMERNFISEDEKEEMLKTFINSFSLLSRNYLGHADFAKKYILKRFKEMNHQQAWYR